MLQWTGGSRRKVYTSRKSTQSRQRQYFEQKKRQQQQNQNDVAGGQASHDKEPRSLDVLSINNLATPSIHHNEPANAEGAITQLDFTLPDASPTEALNDITSLCNSNMNERGSQPRLASSFSHQDPVAGVNSHEQPLGSKISPSINYITRKQYQNLALENEISLIDLASYEGSKNKSTARPAREAHVSLSVKGLGHIKMETPPHSPISIKRDLPLPPMAMRLTHKAKRSIPFDVTKALDSMNSINMLNERRPPDKISKFLDESDHVGRKQFNCYFPESFKSHNADLNLEDEDMFYEPRARKDLQSKRNISGGNLADENSDRLWRIDQFNSKDHFATSGDEHFDTVDYRCNDRYSPERRNSTRSRARFDNTGIPSSHDLFSDCLLMDDDNCTELFEWERHPPSKKISNSNSTFGPSARPFDMGDDSERKRSPISEESCSSAAAMKDRPCKKPSPSVKNEMDKKDEFHMNLDDLDIPNMDTHLHGISYFSNPEKVGYKRTTHQKKLETGYWPERATEQPRTREPSCRLSLEEKFSSWGSPTSHLNCSTGLSTVMNEDKSSFKSASDMSTYQTESAEKRSARKVHSVFHEPDNIIFEDGIHMQHPVSDIFGDKIEMSNLFRAQDLHGDIDMGTSFGHNEEKKQEDNFATISNRNADIFCAKKAVGSVRQTVGRQSICSQPSGTDSLRHGFTPGFSFQESEQNTFWEDSHASNGTFQGELGGLLAREKSDKNDGKIEESKKPDTKMLTKTCQLSADHKNEMPGAETCSVGSEVFNNFNNPEVQKGTCAATKQITANLSCLQETSTELFQAHAHVRPVTSENLDDPGVGYEAPLCLRNETHDIQDQTEIDAVFQSPFVGEVGIEKKIMASVSPNNSDVQYQFMLEQRVLQRLCVQKIVLPTPMKDKLNKDKRFRMTEDGSHVLAKNV